MGELKSPTSRKIPMALMTTYQQDFITHKDPKKRDKIGAVPEQPDIIGGAFKEYLRLQEDTPADLAFAESNKIQRNDFTKTWEPPTEYYKPLEDRVVKRYPYLKPVYYANPLEKKLVELMTRDNGRTAYHCDYCRYEDGIVSKQTLKRGVGKDFIRLPDDWQIPQTQMTISYRDPRMLRIPPTASSVVVPPPPKGHSIKTKTGESEYKGVISRIGTRRLQERPTKKSYTDRVDAGVLLQHIDWLDLNLISR